MRGLLGDRAAWPDVLARTETADTYDTGLWRALAADLGCAGLVIGEEHGGAGASWREAAVVAEETGRHAAPVPFLGSAVTATAAALAAGDAGLLAGLADGEVTAALAVPFPAASFAVPAPTVAVGALRDGDPPGVQRLTGTVTTLIDALPADRAAGPRGRRARRAVRGARRRRGGDPDPGGVPGHDPAAGRPDPGRGAGRRVAAGDAAAAAVRAGLTAGAVLLASEQLGLAERCLEMTVAYVKERKQFARPVGSFQALKHRLADLWTGVTQARAAARYAAACLADGDPDLPVAVALAKAACSDIALKAAQECIQLHGGIGFTWEHPAHLYLKRAKSSAAGYGTADRHRATLAALAGLPPAGQA